MIKFVIVICCKAGTTSYCDGCPHSVAHEKEYDPVHPDISCSSWGDCGWEKPYKVRCVKLR